jgi:hypothetical protein
MKLRHTNSFTRSVSLEEGILFLISLGYVLSPKDELQVLGYTDGTRQLTKSDGCVTYYASVSPNRLAKGCPEMLPFDILY